jgi:hypothetical protein
MDYFLPLTEPFPSIIMEMSWLTGKSRHGFPCRGKSALQRTRCRVTPGMGKPVGLGHRNIPPEQGKGEMVVQETTRVAVMRLLGNPHREQG